VRAGGALTPSLRSLYKNNQLETDSYSADKALIILFKDPTIMKIALRALSIGIYGAISLQCNTERPIAIYHYGVNIRQVFGATQNCHHVCHRTSGLDYLLHSRFHSSFAISQIN